jgi:NADH-quinone oxidoreductase subunit H
LPSAVAEFLNEHVTRWISWALSFIGLGFEVAPDHTLGYVLMAGIHIGLLIAVVAGGALFFIWLERKVSGRIQDRLGPTRVGGKFGWLQTLADGIKLLAKEGVILAGYASGSKWSLFGGMREAAQVVSYEVPLGLCVVVPVLVAGSMNLMTIADQQAGWFTNWLVFHDPFTFIVFWVYFTCATASVNRAPFDLAEAESELVAGFHTEYSGLRWSFFFMAEYGSMFAVSGLGAILFFGGWHGPIPIFGPDMLGWAYAQGATEWTVMGYLATLAGCVNFMFKTVFGVTVMMWVRWTLPRLRIDQVMTTCLKYCTPIAAVCFAGAAAWTAAGIPFINDLAPQHERGAVREGWILEADEAASRRKPVVAEPQGESPSPPVAAAVDAVKPAASAVAALPPLQEGSSP